MNDHTPFKLTTLLRIMSITVRFFASLREQVGCTESILAAPAEITVEQVWQKSTHNQPLPDNLLSAINQEYADLSRLVHDGDEVAFFPPVTGG